MDTKHCVIAILVVLIFAAAGIWLLPAWQDYCETRDDVTDLERQYLQHEAENERLKSELHRLKTDARAIERVARDKFGYTRPQEKVYDFRQQVQATPR